MKELKRILPVTRVDDTEVIELVPLSEFVKKLRTKWQSQNKISKLLNVLRDIEK